MHKTYYLSLLLNARDHNCHSYYSAFVLNGCLIHKNKTKNYTLSISYGELFSHMV
jgi:hypothetical protein